jgi:hypothetical protein
VILKILKSQKILQSVFSKRDRSLKEQLSEVKFSVLSIFGFTEHSSPEIFSPYNSSPEDFSLEKKIPEAEDSSPEYSSPE